MSRPFLLIFGAAASLALSACASNGVEPASAAAEVPTAQATDAMPLSVALHAPRSGLYAAGQPAATDWAAIAARGVTTVINLRPPAEMQGRDEAAEVRAAGMEYRELPVDGAAGITPESARRLAGLLAAAPGPVLVHCSSSNRVGGMLAVMQAQAGMPAQQALEFGRAAGMKSTETRVRELLGVPAEKEK